MLAINAPGARRHACHDLAATESTRAASRQASRADAAHLVTVVVEQVESAEITRTAGDFDTDYPGWRLIAAGTAVDDNVCDGITERLADDVERADGLERWMNVRFRVAKPTAAPDSAPPPASGLPNREHASALASVVLSELPAVVEDDPLDTDELTDRLRSVTAEVCASYGFDYPAAATEVLPLVTAHLLSYLPGLHPSGPVDVLPKQRFFDRSEAWALNRLGEACEVDILTALLRRAFTDFVACPPTHLDGGTDNQDSAEHRSC